MLEHLLLAVVTFSAAFGRDGSALWDELLVECWQVQLIDCLAGSLGSALVEVLDSVLSLGSSAALRRQLTLRYSNLDNVLSHKEEPLTKVFGLEVLLLRLFPLFIVLLHHSWEF